MHFVDRKIIFINLIIKFLYLQLLLNYFKVHNFCSKDDRNYGSCKPGPRVPQNTVIIIFPEDITGKITGQDVEEALLQKNLKVARKLY